MKARGVFGAVLLTKLAWTAPVLAAQSVPLLDMDRFPLTYDGIAEVAAHAQALHCTTSACTAMVVIHGIGKIYRDEWDNEIERNGAIYENGQGAIARRRLEHLLLRHRPLFAPVCAMSKKIMERIHLGPDPDAMTVGVDLMDTAVDMDLRGGGHCAAALVAALPRDAENDRIRINSQTACLYEYVGHPRPKSACDALAEGAVDRGY